MASGVRGGAAIRRILRNLPEGFRQELITGLNSWGRELAGVMRARTPKRSGRLVGGIGYKVYPKVLRLRVGLIVSKRERNALFYARVLDLGRKGRTVQARKRLKSGGVSTYAMNVSPIRAMKFVTGPLSDLRSGLNRHIKGIWGRALRRVAGVG